MAIDHILGSAVGEDTQGDCFINRLAAVAGVEFLVDVLQVCFYGCR